MRRVGVVSTVGLVLLLAGCGGAADNGSSDSDSGGKGGAPKSVPGFDGKTIKLGVLTPLSGPVAVIGLPLTAGNEVWFDYLNKEKGGIAGKYKVELVQQDTQYAPDKTVQQYNKIKGQVTMFTQVLGTAPTLAVLPQLKRDKMLASPASLDAFWVREENLLPVGGPYQIQAINALDYYVNEAGGKGKNVCSFIQDDAYGEAGQAGVDFAAQELGFKVVDTEKFKAGDKDVTGQVQRLQKKQCDAVFLVATPTDAGTIWGTAAKIGFAPRWIGQSPSWINALATSPLAPYLKKTTWIAAEGTEWGDDSIQGMKDMVERTKTYKPDQKPDYYFAFGYNQARAVTAVLEKAVELGDLSHAGILKASDELGTVSFDGLTGDYQYGPADKRNPPRNSTIFQVDPSKPFGLGKLKYDFESDAASKYEFKKADL
jgi:ABC-type branched-subunit amino acid transport system substrate-binding protein